MKSKEISNVMKQTAPVFIMGTKRSGTSIVYRTIQKHSAFRPKQIDLTETAVFSMATRSYRFKNDQPWQLINYMLKDQEQYERFLAGIRPYQKLQRLLDIKKIPSRAANKSSITRKWWWIGIQSHQIVRTYFHHAQIARGCARIVEKTPHNIRFIPQIMHTFPHAKLICMVRHPIDVFSSRQRRGQMDNPNHGNLLMTPEEFCQSYDKFTQTALAQSKKHSQSILFVQYETFTSQPAAEFASICEFLGAPFEEEATVEKKPNPTKWEADPFLFDPIVAKTKKWQDYMTVDEAQFIEQKLASNLETFGYERYTS
ncbi:MAG: sulfotransferase [Chloroflexi bacterium]|nr:sulfotransferase [Chloroflexota bacterium]